MILRGVLTKLAAAASQYQDHWKTISHEKHEQQNLRFGRVSFLGVPTYVRVMQHPY